MTYAGNKPLVFAAQLEKIEQDKDNGNVAGMKPASQVNQLLAPGDRICSQGWIEQHGVNVFGNFFELYFFIIWEFGPVFVISSAPPNCS